ncbi:MAG TPA: DUF115 domain-containing protein [Chlamydiales bacterium]|nr:DUF115 domain-containing protein [Chlamydiales bacterium]
MESGQKQFSKQKEIFAQIMKQFPFLGMMLHTRTSCQKFAEVMEDHVDFSSCLSDALYIYGVAGLDNQKLLHWALRDTKRSIILIDDHLESFDQWMDQPYTKELLESKQLLLIFFDEGVWKSHLWEFLKKKNISQNHFFSRYTDLEKLKKFEKLKQTISSLHAFSNAYLGESVGSPFILKNYLKNYSHLKRSIDLFKMKNAYQNIPAIIVGAGPSLTEDLEHIKKWKNKGLIFAGGSAIAALSDAGISPHYAVAVDPSKEEYNRLKKNKAISSHFLYSLRVFPDVFSFFSGDLGYFSLEHPLENVLLQDLGHEAFSFMSKSSPEGMSVSISSLYLAAFFGCNPIILSGMDLSYVDQKRYARGILDDGENNKIASKKAGGQIVQKNDLTTNVFFEMEARAITYFIEQFPHIDVYNTSMKGLVIQKTEKVPLQELLKKHSAVKIDLDLMIHLEHQKAKQKVDSWDAYFKKIEKSFQHTINLIQSLKTEENHSKKALLKILIQEELIFIPVVKLMMQYFEERDLSFEMCMRAIEPILIDVYQSIFEK